MGKYRISRNIEASLIHHIQDELEENGWTGIAVEKTFKRVYGIPVDTIQKSGAICVRLSTTVHSKVDVGSDSTTRVPTIFIDVFASNDGQRLDLKDFLIDIIKGGFYLYEYDTATNTIKDKISSGRISVTTIEDDEVNLDIDKSNLAVHDRYRHLLTLTLRTGKVEE